ncbi:hypothetical protein EHS39_24120 [Ensifer sp. MPMI2T]|nr:hypothetical protein EHS39_24120 [Ensifer sp. MPMI2T]
MTSVTPVIQFSFGNDQIFFADLESILHATPHSFSASARQPALAMMCRLRHQLMGNRSKH